MPAGIYVYVRDVDAAYQRALSAGATFIMQPADQFYGDRNCGVKNSNGVTWWIGTHVEDVRHKSWTAGQTKPRKNPHRSRSDFGSGRTSQTIAAVVFVQERVSLTQW